MPLDSLCHHHADELLVVDVTITINISLSDHLIDFLVGEFLSKVGHNVTELSGRNETVAISIEDLKASTSSSSVSVSFILRAMRERNSGKSMVPLPSASTSLIMSWSSASV